MLFLNRDRLSWCHLELIDCQTNVVFTSIESSICQSVTVLLQVSL